MAGFLDRHALLRQWLWFIGLWLAGVSTVLAASAVIKYWLQ